MLFRILMLISIFSLIVSFNQNIEAAQVVRIATVTNFPPFEMMDHGKLVGFDIDLINAIVKTENFKVKWYKIIFPGLTQVVQTHTISRNHFNLLVFSYLMSLIHRNIIDIAIAGITITPQRAKVVYFSRPYYRSGVSILVKKNSPIRSWINVRNKKVAVEIGTEAYNWASKTYDIKLKGFTTINEMYNQLQGDKVEAVIANNIKNLNYIKTHHNVKIVGKLLDDTYCGIVIAKQNPKLLKIINAGLKKIIKNGIYLKVYRKYFGTDKLGRINE